MVIETFDRNGKKNGWLLPIWKTGDSATGAYRPDQVYLTVVLSGCSKGPHLHLRRTGLFFCIRGEADIITRDKAGVYTSVRVGQDIAPLLVPPGTPCEIRCAGSEPAYILNLCSPAWSADDPDDHEVIDWAPDGVINA